MDDKTMNLWRQIETYRRVGRKLPRPNGTPPALGQSR
jgi:hypothetical protein